jgi:hypothetical protein
MCTGTHTREQRCWGSVRPPLVLPRLTRAVWWALQRRLGAVMAHSGVRSATQLLRDDVSVEVSALELRAGASTTASSLVRRVHR